MTQKDLRYGDNCTRCNAASGIDTCPHGGKGCPLAVKTLPANYYKPRVTRVICATHCGKSSCLEQGCEKSQ